MTTFKKIGNEWAICVGEDQAKTLCRGSFLMVTRRDGKQKKVKVTEVIRNKTSDFGILCKFVEV